MPRPGSRIARLVALFLLAGIGSFGILAGPTRAAYADTYTPISEDGSSWAFNAIDGWRAAVHTSLTVNVGSQGSVTGLNEFAGSTVDFAASDVPYGLPNAATPGVPGRAFVYVPDVAGGTALMYNLAIGGQKYQNLKLSQTTIAGIFAGTITTWNDAAIKKDNPAVAGQLPSQKITPVVRSDGSGSTALFTQWLSYRGSPYTCGETTFFIQCSQYKAGAPHQAVKGDDGIAGYVKQFSGSIGYVQYSYAVKSGMPAAKVLNKGGYYVLPTPSNASVALLKARINQDKGTSSYLTQDLTDVYADTDPRAYPISSYSYFVLPTTGFDAGKGRSVSYFANYALCQGQRSAMLAGYSPLPKNLVQAGLSLLSEVPGHISGISIKNCADNPTFSARGENLLAKNALYPDRCDKAGAAADCTYGTAANGGKSGSTAGQGDNNSSHAGDGTGNTSSGGGTPTTTTGGGAGTPIGGAGAPGTGGAGTTSGGSDAAAGGTVSLLNPDGVTSCDPDTGQCTKLVASPVDLPASAGSVMAKRAMWLVIAAVLVLILVPPVLVIGRRTK
ncbi:MAG TPA: phosphate ABC transporter substrate-binding protein PstS [Nocardioides sp.]|nr:phosphate ABC transporter substrate-binding protein PstS [Nocardioides sp.]